MSRRARPALRSAAILVVGLLGGLLVARLAFGADGSSSTARVPNEASATQATLPPTGQGKVPAAGKAAPDPLAAVEGFLTAEAAGDFARSWDLLAAEDRARFMSPAGWVAAHEQIPPVTGFQAGALAADGSVPVLLQLKAGLDGVLGLVPARAESTWHTTAEDGGWRVAFTASELRPVLLDERGAAPAALAWATARQQCDTTPVEQHGALVGVPGLARRLCDTVGSPAASEGLTRLASADATRFVSAFGPDVVDWARVVQLETPLALRAVLAPIGDRWLVIGALPALTQQP